ncbi:putative SNARE protein (Ufe1) [Penicillium brasilianum]|uniref:Putative SNARE protein (Ufe1) n=1 Tax=Penicillium brasilianum TaxID=104259 RepID=A0A1S9RA01_PENBI|nr:putative SNARE protein (Ufe1) [Penicillium brasilianum]
MTDLTPTLNTLLSAKNGQPIPPPSTRPPSTEVADEFLKEAHRINSHITSLLKYLHSIRHAYLTTTAHFRRHPKESLTSSHSISTPSHHQTNLTDPERDEIDTSTALLLRDLATSITNLSSAETLRQETSASILRKKYGHSAAGALLWRWAGGGSALDDATAHDGKSAEQIEAEERAKTIAGVREGVLWFLRRELDGVAGVQRGMVEKRIERAREKEKSVLYKRAGAGAGAGKGGEVSTGGERASRTVDISASSMQAPDATVLSEAETARIEAQLSPEQLQLFAEENDTMLRHYEDTLGKVQNAEKSLLEISSLQETLVSHLATQEEYISQLVSDVDTTQSNVGRGNKELKRATERRSTAQAVFWGTVGLCTWLVVWDLVF